jgi:3-oxoadipate enol-lactonase
MKLSANGIQMNYVLEGPANGPMVTMSHSLATDLSMWDPQAKALARRYRVLRYDTRGHGGTDAPAGAYSLSQLADDARALLKALGIARTHWIGLSMGGMIGQTLALSSPEILQSLGLCDTSSRIPADMKHVWDERIATVDAKGMDPMVEPTVARWFTPKFIESHKDVIEPVRAMIRRTPAKGYVGCCHAIKALDLTERLKAITLPTLIIVGAQDMGTPLAASQAINQQIKGSQLLVLDPASHLSNLEQPEAFTNALEQFLSRVA